MIVGAGCSLVWDGAGEGGSKDLKCFVFFIVTVGFKVPEVTGNRIHA